MERENTTRETPGSIFMEQVKTAFRLKHARFRQHSVVFYRQHKFSSSSVQHVAWQAV